MKKVIGIIGWRGLVGSLLLDRIKRSFNCKQVIFWFFSSKSLNKKHHFLVSSINFLAKCDIIIHCNDSLSTGAIYPKLKAMMWNGYWLDFSSHFRKSDSSIVVLDPINKVKIINALKSGVKIFCGGNCTVSLMLMALGGIIEMNIIREIHCTTFQSMSGSGVSNTIKFFKDISLILKYFKDDFSFANLNNYLNYKFFTKVIGSYLPFSVTPWIGDDLLDGNSEEENKGEFESNKILSLSKKISVHSTCVRVNVFRCHSLSLVIFLSKDVSIGTFLIHLRSFSKYVTIINNDSISTFTKLHPVYVSGRDKIYVGRVRKLSKRVFSLFVVGDQLIWGASEPVFRMLKILCKYLSVDI